MAVAKSPAASPAKQLSGLLARYTPQMSKTARAARTRLRRQVPGGIEFVYDNYNALVLGYGPSERPSEAVLSLAILPDHVTLCFLKGARMPDPGKLLKGSGNLVRHIRLSSPAMLEEPAVRSLIGRAVAAASPPFPADGPSRTVIQSISAKQRPRRPA
ncbi:MAG TPA: hypothetical protein VGP80_11505 [Gemmatimonadales bacterium]|jgi:hypothetical protein|nr:hypothetical protein [Gemmatimonadales bacterium]